MRYAFLLSLPLLPLAASAAMLERFQFNGHTYEIYDDARTWADAAAHAATLSFGGSSGYLWNVGTSAENNEVFGKLWDHEAQFSSVALDGGAARYVWLGASDAATEGTWVWTEGNVNFWNGEGSVGMNPGGAAVGGAYNNWGGSSFGSPSEPDDYLGAQDAAAIALDDWPFGGDGEWNDISSGNSLPYVVEYNAVPEPSAYAGVAAAGAFALAVYRRRVRR